MPILVIDKPEDVKKLIGWTIKDAALIPGTPPIFKMRLSFPGAEGDIVITVRPGVAPLIQPGGIIITTGIHIHSGDVNPEAKDA